MLCPVGSEEAMTTHGTYQATDVILETDELKKGRTVESFI